MLAGWDSDADRYLTKNARWWNPLTDDGDALRLAVKLQLTIKFHYGLVLIGNEKKLLADEADEDYKYAIVRAAAAIARATHKEQT